MANKVALYIRVSTAKQADEGISLEAQEALLRQEVASMGATVYKCYIDAGISGANLNRPALQAMLSDAHEDLFDTVAVWKISRLSRSLQDLLTIVDVFIKHDIELMCISEKMDFSSVTGRFMLEALGAVAQWQRDVIRSNCKMGSRQRAQNGKHCGIAPYGYRAGFDESDQKTKWIIDEAEASTVKEIFSMYLAGNGYKAIANRLNARQMKSRKDKGFSASQVSRVLHNEVYIGKIRYDGELFNGVHEAIITADEWKQAQERLQCNRKVRKIVDYDYLLAGLVKCPACGTTMVPTHVYARNKSGSVRRNYYYTCNLYLNKGITKCRGNVVRAKDADAAVIAWMERYITSKEWQDYVIRTLARRSMVIRAVDKDKLLRSKKNLNQQLSRLMKRYELGYETMENLTKESARLNAHIKSMDDALANIGKTNLTKNIYSEESVRNAFKEIEQIMLKADRSKVKALLKNVIKAVYVDVNREVNSLEVYLMPWETKEQDRLTIKIKINERVGKVSQLAPKAERTGML